MSNETLEKSKCVRCGDSVSGGTKGSRCKSCMDKLTSKRKTVGTKERAWRKADSATRRQSGTAEGKNVTAPGTKKGHGEWSEIAAQHQRAEKKTGQKLSPDRVDNKRGYESKNTRAVPEKLNRGRHKVDPKKLAEWKKRLKKAEITIDEFSALLKIKLMSPEQQMANRAANIKENNNAAMQTTNKKPNANKDLAAKIHHIIHNDSPDQHAIQAAMYKPDSPAHKAHMALSDHHDSTKPLSQIEIARHHKTLKEHYNS